MQYSSGDFGAFYTPVVGVLPEDSKNLFPLMPNGIPLSVFPGKFGEYTLQTPNHYMGANPSAYSRQTTMVRPSVTSPPARRRFYSGFLPFPGPQAPGLFRRRNSTTSFRNTRRPRAFRRSNSSATNNSRVFVPKVYTTDVYPVKFQKTSNSSPSYEKVPFASPFSNASTNISRMNTPNHQEEERSGYGSERSMVQLKPRKNKRNPNFEKSSPLDRAFNSLKGDLKLPKIETQDAVQFFEGMILAALSLLRSLILELRSDVIMGLFEPADPDYDAARSYYYTNLKEKAPKSGFTERIDYAEAIEQENKNRAVILRDTGRMVSTRESVAVANLDFMNMTEQEFEEFLIRQAYPEAPLSVCFHPSISFCSGAQALTGNVAQMCPLGWKRWFG